jgi:hypothetical protein
MGLYSMFFKIPEEERGDLSIIASLVRQYILFNAIECGNIITELYD